MPKYTLTITMVTTRTMEADSDLHAKAKAENMVAKIEERARDENKITYHVERKPDELFGKNKKG